MRKIIISLGLIAAVSALTFGATRAFFSDTEKSVGNTFAAGTIDISVDGQNPWTTAWHSYLDKPSQTNYMNITIRNEGANSARVWKRITDIVNAPGTDSSENYECLVPDLQCEPASTMVSSEPECQDGTANYTKCYEERDNLSAFMIYDMSYCVKSEACACLVEGYRANENDELDMSKGAPITEGDCWQVIIDPSKEVRVDNVAGTFIELTMNLPEGLLPEQEMVVSQSYHLMVWTDSGQPIITNWAQGDTMTFSVELDARQMDAPAPGQEGWATANLVAKDTITWDQLPANGQAILTYKPVGAEFEYSLTGSNLADGTYQLIYYPDPWANPKTVTLVGSPLTISGGVINVPTTSVEISSDIPTAPDANIPAGGKVWLVPTTSLSSNSLSWTNTENFLFDTNLVNYNDTDE